MSQARAAPRSAGLLLYRVRDGRVEVFLAHPGGPFWKNRDAGAWTIPKGLVEPGEEPFEAACREFEEETGIVPQGPFYPLGMVRQKAGKQVDAWAWEGDADADRIVSNQASVPQSAASSARLAFPEIDRCAWFGTNLAREKINPAQAALIDRLEALILRGGLNDAEDDRPRRRST